MATMQLSTIDSLKTYQRTWTVKVIVLRQGSIDSYDNGTTSGTIQKMILMDEKVSNYYILTLLMQQIFCAF